MLQTRSQSLVVTTDRTAYTTCGGQSYLHDHDFLVRLGQGDGRNWVESISMPRAWSTTSCCATRRVLQPHPGSVAVLRIRGLTSISDGRVQEAGSTLDLSRGALYPPTLLLLLLFHVQSLVNIGISLSFVGAQRDTGSQTEG